MKLVFILFSIIPFLGISQHASIFFEIENASMDNLEVSLEGVFAKPEVLFGDWIENIPLHKGRGNWIYNLSKPAAFKVSYGAVEKNNYFDYYFFLSPGDSITFKKDENGELTSIDVSGKGSENNQPLIQFLHDDFLELLYSTHKNDTLPQNVYRAIQKKSIENKKILSDYIEKYSPTQSFIDHELLYTKYFLLMQYSLFKGTQRFNVWKEFSRNENKWHAIEDSLVGIYSINDDALLNVFSFTGFLSNYLVRLKERLWFNPELKETYIESDLDKTLVENDPENWLSEKIINKHFKGDTEEFLYAFIFRQAINTNEDNLPEIFERFISKYPNSIYIPYLKSDIDRVIKLRATTLRENVFFIENSDSLKTFSDILNMFTGQTVLLDMWGTWCGPCRSEIHLNSEAIKKHFENRDVKFLYIANYDLNALEKWKELIAYYNLSGTHILASKMLTEDIMSKLKRNSYPTYAIIKKDGSFELSEAGYPMNRKILFNQLERILSE